jgi:hypothetical protein
MYLWQALALLNLYIFGIYWCYVVIWRFRDDIKELCEKEVAPKIAIIFVWIITVLIVISMFVFAFIIIGRLAWSARELL